MCSEKITTNPELYTQQNYPSRKKLSRQKDKYYMAPLICEILKNTEFRKSNKVVSRDWRMGEIGRGWQRDKLSVLR